VYDCRARRRHPLYKCRDCGKQFTVTSSTNSTIIQVEAGNRKPQIDTIEIFACAMGVSAGWLAYGQGIAPDWLTEETKES